jgi:GTP-binding protein
MFRFRIVLLAFAVQAHADSELMAVTRQMEEQAEDRFFDIVFDSLVDRVLMASRPQDEVGGLDDTTLGKTGQLATVPSSGLATQAARAAPSMPISGLGPQYAVERRSRPVRAMNHRAGPAELFRPAQAHRTAAVTCAAPTPSLAKCRNSRHRRARAAVAPQATADATATAEETESTNAVVRDDMRNIAIVAHVDHGKTTLVDAMLVSARDDKIGKDDRVMDSNDQERERGITILAKNAAIEYKGTKINIVDTPGHADFGGEVERVLNMVDGVLLLVDASEGPKPQTRFVLKKAIAMGLKVLVVVNKIDRPTARPDYVMDKTFDLFCELGASDEQTDFPVVYTSAINRVAGDEPTSEMKDMEPLFEKILGLPKPPCDPNGPLQLQISNIASDNFIGRLGIGRIQSGTLKKGGTVGLSEGPGTEVKQVKVSEIFNFDAMGRASIDEAMAGEIVTFAGVSSFNIGDTLVDPNDPRPLAPITVEQPTMSMTFGVNKSPFGGKVGKQLTSRQIKDRLMKELETNVAMRVENTEDADTFLVSGRGLLHLTVLMETMRREGFEIMVGPPKVIEKTENGQRMEPFEMVDLELPEEYSGAAIDLLNNRKGCMLNMGSVGEGNQNMQYEVPSRGMSGIKGKLLTATRGLVVMTTTFAGYREYAGDFPGRDRGNMLSTAQGPVTTYAVTNAQQRGALFVKIGDDVYENQIIGTSARDSDVQLNVCKEKALTNMRAAGKDDSGKIVPPKEVTLEEAVEYIVEGEYVEIVPGAIRMGQTPKKKDPRR